MPSGTLWADRNLGSKDKYGNGFLYEWESNKDKTGYRVIGPNGESIFLPVAGCILGNEIKYSGQFGYYWTGESHSTNPSFARELLIGLGQINIENGKKNVGRSIRPVYKKDNN